MTPQLENGYTKIANEILEAMARFRIPGEQRQCLDFILRKTYGYNKKEDAIANSQFCEATGLKKGNVSRAIKALVDKNIVIKNDNRKIPTYQFNKHFKQWRELSKKQPVIKKATVVIKNDNKVLSKVMDTKESKETFTRDKESKPKKLSPPKFNAKDFKPDFFTNELWETALAIRKEKKVSLSEIALKPFVRELKLATTQGFTLQDCLEQFATAKWTRFKAEFMRTSQTGSQENQTPSDRRADFRKELARGLIQDGLNNANGSQQDAGTPCRALPFLEK